MIRTYSELITFNSFKERYLYLKLEGVVGESTFGSKRYLNQILYNSPEWKRCKQGVIIRDYGRDLGCDGFDIRGTIIIHHINPITIDDILNRRSNIFDPENLISSSHNTHQAIHYGDETLLPSDPIERIVNDTCPWRVQHER